MTIQKNPFLKYVMKDDKQDIFHSSAYAKAQNGEALGAASSESYQVRVKIDQNRQAVRRYGDSEIMTGSRNPGVKAKTYTPPAGCTNMGPAPMGGNGVARGGNAAPMGGSAASRAAIPMKNPGIRR